MRVDTLPSPGRLSMGIQIRTIMAKAISAIELQGTYTGKATEAWQFDQFLQACRTAVATFIETVAPTVLARFINSAEANKVYIQASEGIDPKFVPLPAAFAITGVAKTISKVEIDGPYIVLTVTVPFVNGNVSNVAYTQPGGAANLRDLSGNLLASFAATAIVNNVAA